MSGSVKHRGHNVLPVNMPHPQNIFHMYFDRAGRKSLSVWCFAFGFSLALIGVRLIRNFHVH